MHSSTKHISFGCCWRHQATDNKLTFIQVMALCHLATSHCMCQCWQRSLMPCVASPGCNECYNSLAPGKFVWNLRQVIFITRLQWVNSLAPGKFAWNFRQVIFKHILAIDDWGISCEIALIWMSLNFIDDQSTFVQVMVWCHQATSHYLQCWPISLSPYDITRPQWVK